MLRRHAVGGIVFSALVGAVLAKTRAFAQEGVEGASLELARKEAEVLLARAKELLSQLPLSQTQYEELRRDEIDLRLRLAFALAQVPEPQALAWEYGFVDPELFKEFDVPLVPIEPYPPYVQDLVSSRGIGPDAVEITPAQDCEPVALVLIDMIGTALDVSLSDVGEAILKVPAVEKALEELNKALGSEDAEAFAQAVVDLVGAVFDREAIATIVQKFVERQGKAGAQRFLAALAARCVPFVGYALLFVGVVLAISNNYGRLQRAIECQVDPALKSAA